MALPIGRADVCEAESDEESFEQSVERLKADPETRAQLLAQGHPFDADAWQRGAIPPTQQELAALETFLSELHALRDHDVDGQHVLVDGADA
jgi:hypothetical protein